MHEKIQDVMNTLWSAYKKCATTGNTKQSNEIIGRLLKKYRRTPLFGPFASAMAMAWVPVINAMAEEKRNEQQASEKEKK